MFCLGCGSYKAWRAKLCLECYKDIHIVKKYTNVNPRHYLFIDGKMVHRLIMEKELGRSLESDEHVHHVNENKHDNRPENLFVCSRSHHGRLHSDKGQQSIFGRALMFRSFGYI